MFACWQTRRLPSKSVNERNGDVSPTIQPMKSSSYTEEPYREYGPVELRDPSATSVEAPPVEAPHF